MKNIGLIIVREFKERVYKKSFIITTLLMPLLLALISVAPTLIMIYAKGDTCLLYTSPSPRDCS